jgi:activator of HSP90 ATPase
MSRSITQKILFKNTTPKALYTLYLNAKKHSVATGAGASISNKTGDKFSAHDGYITGQNIYLVKDKLIVQSWRTKEWDKKEGDSIFIICLEPKGKNVILHMIHAKLPDKHADSINSGWRTYYWEPWKKFLAGNPIQEYPQM